MSEEQDIELIELYINNKLDRSERERIDNRLKTENDFLELFKDMEILLQGVKTATRRELVSELKAIEESLPDAQTRTLFSAKTYWWIGAAASVTLIVLAFVLWNRFASSTNEKLFTEYFEPYPNVLQSSVRGVSDESQLSLALQFYEEKEYSTAIEKLEAIEGKDFGVFFYLGSSYLALKDTERAILNFEKNLQSDNKLNTQAEWYLALCYLIDDNMNMCIPVLKSIASKENPYSTRANELLTKLKIP